jgi:putative chitinase
MVQLADLLKIAGRKHHNQVTLDILNSFNKYADRYGVNTPQRIAAFLARISVETGGFTQLEENLNYSAKRLTEVWPSRFPTLAAATPYARNPKALANKVYGNRLGNPKSGKPNAGWDYRGSGPGQVTGYDNFVTVARETGIPCDTHPSLLREADSGMKAALHLWQKWGLNELADGDQITNISKRWNGGVHGLSLTKRRWRTALKMNLIVPKRAPLTARPATKSTAPEQKAAPKSNWLVRLFRKLFGMED